MHTTLSRRVQYRLGWGIPFINRVRDFSINGVPYDDLPDRILVGTSSFIAPYVHGREGDEERGRGERMRREDEGRGERRAEDGGRGRDVIM